jgi:hypothetical protein
MFHLLTSILLRFRASPAATLAPPANTSSSRIDAYSIHVGDRIATQLRRAAGITVGDLVELIANGRYGTICERAVGSRLAWATTSDARVALAQTPRDLRLLVFDPERIAFFVVFAAVDPDRERFTVTRVTTARHYEEVRWKLLPPDLYRCACAKSIASLQERDRIVAAAIGERALDALPILFALEDDKRLVWVELVMRDGHQKRLGILPFEFKKQRATDLPSLDGFWTWMQTTPPAHDSPITRDAVAAIRLVGQRDPYDVTLTLQALTGDSGAHMLPIAMVTTPTIPTTPKSSQSAVV